MSRSKAQEYYEECCADWDAANEACNRAHAIWLDARERRERIGMARTNAWGELQMAIAQESTST